MLYLKNKRGGETKMRKMEKNEKGRYRVEFKESTIMQWVEQFPEVKRWLKNLQAKEFRALNLYYYCYVVEKTPAELLILKKDPSSVEAELLLKDFTVTDVGLPESKKFNVAIAVRSFYRENLKDLAKAAGQLRYQAKREYNLNEEALRKLYRFCTNPRDRSLLTLLCSTAIAKETLSNLKWKHLEDNWQKQTIPHISLPPQLIKGHGRGKYASVRQETFLTGEGKRDLIEYKQWMEQKLGRKFTEEENVYWTLDRPYKSLDYKGISRIFTALQRNSGVQFSPHDARRWVNTALETVGMPENWRRKIRGRKIRGEEAPYSKPAIDQLRAKFREAVPLLEFTSEKPIISEEERRIQTTYDNLLLTGFSEEEIEKYKKQRGKTWNTAKDLITIIRLRKWTPKETQTNGGFADCQRIVEENDLVQMLAEGWRVAAVLPSGKVVISC